MAGVTATISCNRVSKRVKLQNRASKSPRLAAPRCSGPESCSPVHVCLDEVNAGFEIVE